MKLIIEIEVDNQAFLDDPEGEVPKCLEQCADLWHAYPGFSSPTRYIFDTNGNTVGTFKVID